ncbi:MAG: hypothetical protein ACYC75_03490 [Minisyncoccota bacterium]
MVSSQLLDYARQQVAAGVSKEEIAKSLIAAGWQVSDVNEVMSQISTPPSSTPSINARPIIRPMIYLKEFAKSIGLLIVANVILGISIWVVAISAIFGLNSSMYGLGDSRPSSFILFLTYALWVIGPATLLVFAFRAWRLYKRKGTAVMATSLITLLIYVLVFCPFTSGGIFVPYVVLATESYKAQQNKNIASQIEVSPSRICVSRDTIIAASTVGTSTFSVYNGNLVWDGSITFPEGAVSVSTVASPFNKNDPSLDGGIKSVGTMSVEMPDGSGTYTPVSYDIATSSAFTYMSDGEIHKWRLSYPLDPVNDFEDLEYLTARPGSTPLARGYKFVIYLTNVSRSTPSISFYTATVPDEVLSALFVNTSSKESTPRAICDSL